MFSGSPANYRSPSVDSIWVVEEEDENENLEYRRERLKEKASFIWGQLKENIKAAATLKNIANAVFVIAVSVICFIQCNSQINEYFRFSTRLQVSHRNPNSTLWLLPGLTICNNNRFRMSKLIRRTPELEEKVYKVTNNTSVNIIALFSDRKKIELMNSIREVVERTVNTSELINESPLPELIDFSTYQMVTDINCNALWGEQFNCENFRIIESYQNSPCYTIFYYGAILEAINSGKAYDFKHPSLLLTGKRKLDSFEAHEIAEVFINFIPLDHADFFRDVGGKMVVHSTDHIGSLRDTAHAILPGNSYDIIVRRTSSKRLPPPYKSMCSDYKGKNSYNFITKNNSFASIELDTTTCIRNCIVRQTTKDCNCWPVEVPYFLHDPMINASDTYKSCSWSSDLAHQNFSAAHYVDCYKRFHNECRLSCPLACDNEDYSVHVMSSPWPNRGQFIRAESETKKLELYKLKGCCARISLKYLEFMENQHIMYPSLTLAHLVSNLGGIISALVGISALTIYRYVTRKVFRCKVVSDYMPPLKINKKAVSKRTTTGVRFYGRITRAIKK